MPRNTDLGVQPAFLGQFAECAMLAIVWQENIKGCRVIVASAAWGASRKTGSMTIYEEIGGADAVNAAVDIFYEKVLGDPLLTPFFENVEMGGQNRKQRAFFTVLFKGESDGAEAYMRRSHASLVRDRGLSDEHFGAVATHLNATLDELQVPDHLISQIMGAAAGLKNAVLNR